MKYKEIRVDHNLAFRVDSETYFEIEKLAKSKNKKKSIIIRILIKKGLELYK